MYNNKKVCDSHLHYSCDVSEDKWIEILDYCDTDVVNLVLLPHRKRILAVPEALKMKNEHFDRFFVFSSLNIVGYFIHQKNLGKYFVKHVKQVMKCGCDGIKMIEGKPTFRKELKVPDFDTKTWDLYFKYMEEKQIPILWHVNDPEEFWDEEKVPTWAKQHGWFYDETFVNNIDQYEQILNVLEKYPLLKITFAHFYFMSDKLDELSSILDRFPNVNIDLTPGIELYTNLSNVKAKAKEFFVKYQDRILYGTDIEDECEDGEHFLNHDRCKQRSDLVRHFISDKEDFLVKADDNYLIGDHDFYIHPLGLDDDIVNKILYENFMRFVPIKNKINSKEIIKLIKKCKKNLRIMSIVDKKLKPDFKTLKTLEAYYKNIK